MVLTSSGGSSWTAVRGSWATLPIQTDQALHTISDLQMSMKGTAIRFENEETPEHVLSYVILKSRL
jgi:hypothetical protein